MSSKKPIRYTFSTHISAFWIACSIDSKNKLTEFINTHMGYDEEMVPVIINGTRPFSVYKFSRGLEQINMVIVSRDGIKKICSLCDSLTSEENVIRKLILFFNKYLKDDYSDYLEIFKKISPYIGRHYIDYKDTNLYKVDKLKGRYLCFLYNPSINEVRAITGLLNKISIFKEDDIMKSQITVG